MRPSPLPGWGAVAPVAMSTYATTSDLQSQPGLSLLSDDDCQRLLSAAEELVDDALGTMSVDEATGRKIVPGDLPVWKQDKLRDATVLVAARLQSRPDVLAGSAWTVQKGPDFEVSGPARVGIAAVMTEDVMARIRSLRLRRLTGRARPTVIRGDDAC